MAEQAHSDSSVSGDNRADMVRVSSATLDRAVANMQGSSRELWTVAALNLDVTLPQLQAAATLAGEADPCVISRPKRMASTQERPMWLSRVSDNVDDVLVLHIGILGEDHQIDREGVVR